MSDDQKRVVRSLLAFTHPEEFSHGGCIGADTEAHYIARELNIPIVVRPSNIPAKVGSFSGARVVHPARPPLHRNATLVLTNDALIATPFGDEEVRSGTWTTVRLSRKHELRYLIVERDGNVLGGDEEW